MAQRKKNPGGRKMNPSTLATMAATVAGVAAGALGMHYLWKSGKVGAPTVAQGVLVYPTSTIRR